MLMLVGRVGQNDRLVDDFDEGVVPEIVLFQTYLRVAAFAVPKRGRFKGCLEVVFWTGV